MPEAALTGTHAPRPHAQADASRLHAVLLSTGGGADRLSLIHGFRWTADRLHAAELMLRAQLAGTAEILAAALDGRLELRLRTDRLTSAATSVVQARAHCDDGLSTAATRLVYELLAGPNLGTPVNEIQMPPEISRVALEELRQRHSSTSNDRASSCSPTGSCPTSASSGPTPSAGATSARRDVGPAKSGIRTAGCRARLVSRAVRVPGQTSDRTRALVAHATGVRPDQRRATQRFTSLSRQRSISVSQRFNVPSSDTAGIRCCGVDKRAYIVERHQDDSGIESPRHEVILGRFVASAREGQHRSRSI
jgi:hypothetical protein